jgi:hypothetical protein
MKPGKNIIFKNSKGNNTAWKQRVQDKHTNIGHYLGIPMDVPDD